MSTRGFPIRAFLQEAGFQIARRAGVWNDGSGVAALPFKKRGSKSPAGAGVWNDGVGVVSCPYARHSKRAVPLPLQWRKGRLGTPLSLPQGDGRSWWVIVVPFFFISISSVRDAFMRHVPSAHSHVSCERVLNSIVVSVPLASLNCLTR